jgi:hypothetical protein
MEQKRNPSATFLCSSELPPRPDITTNMPAGSTPFPVSLCVPQRHNLIQLACDGGQGVCEAR